MKCSCCKKKKITIPCKWCNHDLCTSCILVETHKCINIDNCTSSAKLNLENKLLSEKTKKPSVMNF